MSDQSKLTLEKVLRAHAAYSKVLQGLQMAQSGFEELFESGFFHSSPDQLQSLSAAVSSLYAQSRDIAKTKGVLVQLARDVDAKMDVFGQNRGY